MTPHEDWHWDVLRAHIDAELAALRTLWMLKFLPGETIMDRLRIVARDWEMWNFQFRVRGDFIRRYPDLVTKPFDTAAAKITRDLWRIINRFRAEFDDPPPLPSLLLTPPDHQEKRI